ncbi:helix-turn-helix transcriptional regulator [Streptomyces olivaceus]|uniref:helix-turn-helix transcriptional regulator n=1 Tax=Streptomyces olivaceus TaxID=47716 RepID=UPI001CCCCDE4|nr:helix-turn-helix transcriptional regulator [Streptomyces olivaceus]MBZ6130723.1 helix-turn-helix transcriptional regulator [Streptomyces olivaceus]MBZ6247780.1 helix-turn-helix transcriptional regulator [Streptomyces olivaceus]
MDRLELGRVLKAARARLAPGEVGLTAGPRRRVTGLRREEVALLAGVSVEYVVRLEQARGPRPSPQVLTALTRALRLEPDERDQVFRLAGSAPPLRTEIEMSIRPSVLRLLQRLADLPAVVLSAKGDVLAQNPMARALLGDLSRWPAGRRNIVWQRLLGTGCARVVFTPEEETTWTQQAVGLLRTALSRYPDDPELGLLIHELTTGSDRFRTAWEEGRSTVRQSMRKTIEHPEVGRLALDCDTLVLPDTDQSMIVYSAAPGTREASALDALRVIGTEHIPALS